MDKVFHAYTAHRITNRWPMAYFPHIIDVCGVAALVIWDSSDLEWNSNQAHSKRKLFFPDIVLRLVKPQIVARSKKGITESHISEMKSVICNSNERSKPLNSNVANAKKRCHMRATYFLQVGWFHQEIALLASTFFIVKLVHLS